MIFFETQQNYFPKNLDIFKSNYFLPKLLEDYGSLFKKALPNKVLQFLHLPLVVEGQVISFNPNEPQS